MQVVIYPCHIRRVQAVEYTQLVLPSAVMLPYSTNREIEPGSIQ